MNVQWNRVTQLNSELLNIMIHVKIIQVEDFI